MHVHAAQHVAVTDHLQVIHDGAVALFLGDDLLRPKRQRKCAHGGEPQLVLGRGVAERAAIVHEMIARFLHGATRRRRDLDLRLQHFRHDAVAEPLADEAEEFFVDAAHGPARFGVEHEVFLFHADRIHARNNSPGRERVPA